MKPWFGWGWGELDYAHYSTLYAGPRFCEILDNAHNLPLHLAVELGVPAAVLICGAAVGWIVRQKPWNDTDPSRQMAWAVLAVIGLHSMLEYPLWYGPFQMALVLCVLILRRPQGGITTHKYGLNQPIAFRLIGCIAICLIALLAYTAWDYRRVSQIYLEPAARDVSLRDNTLEKIRGTTFFRNQVRFAELGLTPLSPGSAQWTLRTATDLLHYSPEPRVIEKVIDSATLLGQHEVAAAHVARYRAAFPVAHARWANAHGHD